MSDSQKSRSVASLEAASRGESPIPEDAESDWEDYYFALGVASAALGLFVLPEIFGSVAIIIGAYTWRREGREGNRGLGIVILGIVCMLIGLYFTAFFALGNLLP